MTAKSMANNIGLGPRIAEFLRERYSDSRAKRLAIDFNVSVGTAKRWLAGITPTTAIIEEMASRWGASFVKLAFADYLAAGDAEAIRLVGLMNDEKGHELEVETAISSPRMAPPLSGVCDFDSMRKPAKRITSVEPWRKALRELLARIEPFSGKVP